MAAGARNALEAYLREVERLLRSGAATEHSYRPAFQALVEAITGLAAVNEPKRAGCGAPDFVLLDGLLPVGHIECKDLGADLDAVEASDQLQRYRGALPNLILTDYLAFRWYANGERKLSLRIADWDGSRLVPNDAGLAQLPVLLKQFANARAPTIRTAKRLAEMLAGKARLLDALVLQAFEKEDERGELHEQLCAIRELLVPDMTVEEFADMYAQTVAYGLFAARLFDPTPESFSRFEAASLLPPTNPLLRAFFQHLGSYDLDHDPAVAWCIDEMCQLFMHVDIHAVLRDFSQRKGFEDPIVHFYETFLAEYDPKLKKSRGVYYTPEPVVSFIVRSVDAILKEKFGKPAGLADKSVVVLDPATGTATFLRAVIEMVHRHFEDKGQQGMWNAYVPEYVLKRIFGFELLMAPYAVAHLKLGEQLKNTGYDFKSGERLGVFLTNTLEEAAKKSETLLGLAKLISEEADQASHVKRDEPVMVVLGNPPYAGHSANKGAWIERLLADYYQVDGEPLGEKNPKWLQDDYVKFLRFAQWRIERTGQGIVAMITNHGWLDNPTFRGMRRSLMKTFDEIYVLDLHGNAKKK
ncbi:MAG: DNA methyltransferase, partial [Zetaproteobacteria bacterium]